MCDMGADVIKVESPLGDQARHMAGKVGSDSFGFNAVNRGKRGIVVDLRKPEGQRVIRRLAETSDVLVENNRPGMMAKYGLDYASLSPLNPGLIYASISGFGQNGPYASKGGFDLIAVIETVDEQLPVRFPGGPEHSRILKLCRSPLSVAEVASDLELPVDVVRVLLGDLVDHKLILVRQPAPVAQFPNASVLKQVIDGLHAL